MKKQAFYLFLALFAAQAIVLRAQNSEKPAPKFTLNIYLFQNGGAESEMPGQPIFRKIRVVETNTSNEPLQEGGCWEDRGVFSISVLYDGAPLAVKDAAARKKRETEEKHTPCMVPRSKAVINPGETGTRYIPLSIDYPMCKPGTYEITVSRESDLEHPEKSVTVKSDTLTIVVPEPARCDL
jgi:hypothetical protein